MARVKSFQVHIADFNQLDSSEQYGAVMRLVSFFANSGDMRLLSYSLPWQPNTWQETRAKLSQQTLYPWQRRGYEEEIRLGNRLSRNQALHTINHYLITRGSTLQAGHLANWGIAATESAPPSPIKGNYSAGIDHLKPVLPDGTLDRTRPYVAIIASHRFKDQWGWTAPLPGILSEATGPLVVCLDIHHIPNKKVELATNGLQATADTITKISDKEVLLRLQAADFILTQLTQGQSLHHVRLYVMLLDTNLERLKEERIPSLKSRLSAFMSVETLKGYQAGAATVFTPSFNRAGVAVPAGNHNVLSEGVSVMAGGMWGFFSNENYNGIYVGARKSVTGQFVGLHYLDLWRGNSAAHMGIFGQTGKGKTVGTQALLTRQMEQGVQVIVMEPQGHSRRLAALVGEENSLYVQVGYDMTFNPLDIVEPDFSEQVDYFIAILELLLNPRGSDPGRPRRYLSNMEIAAVSEALTKTYRGLSVEELLNDQSKTPTMEVFCARLAQINGGRELATELKRLYVEGPWSATFNATSSLNMRLRNPDGTLIPAIIFDFLKVPEDRRTLFYFALLAAVNREIRKSVPYGQKRPERLFFIDEAHYLMTGSNLAVWLAKQFKTARTFRTGIWVADQDPMTLIGLRSDGGKMLGSEGHDTMSGIYMLNNMPYIMCYGLSLDASRPLAQIYPEFRNSHLNYLAQSGPGQAVLKTGKGVHIIDMVLRPSEEKYLLGS